MNSRQEREHLTQADRHIAECKAYMARQREIIERLTQGHRDTDLAEALLHALEGSLDGFERHRELIIDRLKDMVTTARARPRCQARYLTDSIQVIPQK